MQNKNKVLPGATIKLLNSADRQL